MDTDTFTIHRHSNMHTQGYTRVRTHLYIDTLYGYADALNSTSPALHAHLTHTQLYRHTWTYGYI